MRLSKLGLYGGLLATTLLSTTASAAVRTRLPACASWTDPVGDSAWVVLQDKTLDITGVRLLNDGKTLTASIGAPDYALRPTYSLGNSYQLRVTLNGKAVNIYYGDSMTRSQESMVLTLAGMTVDNTYVAGSKEQVTATVAGGKVNVAVALADLGAAVGTRLTSKSTVTEVEATAEGSVGVWLPYDTAASNGRPISLGACV